MCQYFQLCGQFLQCERFGYVVVGVGFEVSEFLFQCVVCGEYEDWCLFVCFVVQFVGYFQFVYVGQGQVEYDYVEIVYYCQVQIGDVIVGEIDYVVVVFQIIVDVGCDIVVVFNYQYVYVLFCVVGVWVGFMGCKFNKFVVGKWSCLGVKIECVVWVKKRFG